MRSLRDRLCLISTRPTEKEAFDAWLTGEQGLTFLRENASEREFVVYAGLGGHTFIHAVLAPAVALATPDMDDLLAWNFSTSSSWSTDGTSVFPLLHDTGSKSLNSGEQLVFYRSFEGYVGKPHYFEVLQKFLHISGLHQVPERNAYCRLDKHGDLDDVVRIVEIGASGGNSGGTIISIYRDVLNEYASLTGTVIARMFDFTLYGRNFGGWPDSAEESRVADGDIVYRSRIHAGYGSYMRGCQIVRHALSRGELSSRYWDGDPEEKRYASFIVQDWKNNVVREVSCAPGATANYFTKSDLPFELSPAYFRPEVLAKYKADTDKYRLETRSISCRGAWHLQTYDLNEAGQVHTYPVYLRTLPYEEQLHWKQYNEPPKGPISARAFATDFEGSWNFPIDPLNKLKDLVRKATEKDIPWWKLRSEKVFDQVHPPVTTSADEWANEILHLDQLVVEGFEHQWLRKRAVELKRAPEANFGSLKLIEECLMGLAYEPDRARAVVAPLRELHHLRSKLKGHAGGKEALEIRKATLTKHGSFRMHFEAVCISCTVAFGEIAEALGGIRLGSSAT